MPLIHVKVANVLQNEWIGLDHARMFRRDEPPPRPSSPQGLIGRADRSSCDRRRPSSPLLGPVSWRPILKQEGDRAVSRRSPRRNQQLATRIAGDRRRRRGVPRVHAPVLAVQATRPASTTGPGVAPARLVRSTSAKPFITPAVREQPQRLGKHLLSHWMLSTKSQFNLG